MSLPLQAEARCDEPIVADQQMIWGIATTRWMSLQFHQDCFQIWDEERTTLPERGVDHDRKDRV